MRFFDRFLRQKTLFESSQGRFRFGVVGLGSIARYFIDALRDSPSVAVTALVSGGQAKAAAWGRKYGVARTLGYAEFDRLRGDVDAVYLALPVAMHREWTERAAAAGLHVLCEKPMASTSDDARAMIAACGAAGVRLSIAYRCPHHAQHQHLKSLLKMGMLGDRGSLRLRSGFGFPLFGGWRHDPAAAGGGSLFDVGIYPLNASRFLLEEEPSGFEDVSAVFEANGLERTIRWTSVFPSGARAECRSSYREIIPDSVRVTGPFGSLVMAPAFNHRARYRLRGEYRREGKVIRVNDRTPSSAISEFRLEAEELARAVAENRDTITPGEDGLADMVAMEAIYKAAGVRK